MSARALASWDPPKILTQVATVPLDWAPEFIIIEQAET